MRAKVLELRALKCEKGGRLPMDGDDSCEVRVDYVNNCKTKVPDANIWD